MFMGMEAQNNLNLPFEVVLDVRQEHDRYPGLLSGHALVSCSAERFFEEAVAHVVGLDGNLLEVHVHFAFGRLHPEEWRR
jgi:hypothetical protein